MISRIDLRGADLDARALREALPRAEFDLDDAADVVRPICDAVRDRGAAAVLAFGERFDGVTPPQLRVPAEVLQAALTALDPAVRAALEESIRRARIVHAEQRRRRTRRTSSPAARSPSAGCPSTGSGSTCPAASPSTRAAS